MRLTNMGEVMAFLVARVVTYGVMLVMTPVFLGPLYGQLVRSGGRVLLSVVAEGVSVAVWLVTLLLFLVFRAGFAAVPEIVAPSSQRSAVTTSGGEIGAFVLSMVIDLAAVTALNIWVMFGVYASLRASSGAAIALMVIPFGIAIVSAVTLFLLFIAFRAAMSRPAGARLAP